jgi:predicted porin
MKKSLLALAVFGAFATTASAEVTLYGTLDANYGSFKTETTVDGVKSETEETGLFDGSEVTAPSRWGIKASTDLGNGLKGIAHLESQVKLMNGGTNDNLFHRKAIVGLSGGFGTVVFGRFGTPIHDIADEGNAFGTDTLNTYSGGDIAGAGYDNVAGGSRRSNSINYISPDFSGFTAKLQLVNQNEEEDGVETAESKGFGAGVVYENGPMLVGVGYDRNEGLAGSPEHTSWLVSGAYDLGVVKLYAMHANFKNEQGATEIDAKETTIGAKAKMGAFTLLASVGRNDVEEGADEADGTDYTVGVHYHLAKKTFVYARAGKFNHLESAGFETEDTAYAVGLRHSF